MCKHLFKPYLGMEECTGGFSRVLDHFKSEMTILLKHNKIAICYHSQEGDRDANVQL